MGGVEELRMGESGRNQPPLLSALTWVTLSIGGRNLLLIAITASPSESLKKVWHGQEEHPDPLHSVQGVKSVTSGITSQIPLESYLTFKDRVW